MTPPGTLPPCSPAIPTDQTNLHRADNDGPALTAQGVSGGFDLWKLTCWARTYWHRLLGTASSWFVWDFAFYGNKLFQGTFIAIINPGASLIQVNVQNLLRIWLSHGLGGIRCADWACHGWLQCRNLSAAAFMQYLQ